MAEIQEPFEAALKPCSIAVFAPSPVITVTIEPGGNGDSEIHLHAGGQGFWVGRMASRLGARVTLCAPLGGETGEVLRPLLGADGISLRSVPTAGANGAYVHDRRDGARTEIAQTPSPTLARHELDDLYGVTLTAGLEADVTLITGPRSDRVLPPNVFERLCSDLRSNGCPVLADLSGEPLAHALRGGIDLLKVSEEELISDGRLEGRSIPDVLEVARRLADEGAGAVLISRAEAPAVLLAADRGFEVDSPHFSPVDERGAGDSMFAGTGLGIATGLPLELAVKLGAAAGALNVTRHGLGTGQLNEVIAFAQQVKVVPTSAGQSEEVEEEDSAASTAS